MIWIFIFLFGDLHSNYKLTDEINKFNLEIFSMELNNLNLQNTDENENPFAANEQKYFWSENISAAKRKNLDEDDDFEDFDDEEDDDFADDDDLFKDEEDDDFFDKDEEPEDDLIDDDFNIDDLDDEDDLLDDDDEKF